MPAVLTVVSSVLLLASVAQPLIPSQHRLGHQQSRQPGVASDFLGNSPLRYCEDAPRPSDLFWVDRITMDPPKLYIDTIFSVDLTGYFVHSIAENATWTSTARYGNSSESETWNTPFCDILEYIRQPDVNQIDDDHCPPRAGRAVIHMESWVWEMFIVPGDYYFKFEAKNGDSNRIYCLETDIRLDYKTDEI